MPNRKTTLFLATLLGLFLAGFLWVHTSSHARPTIGIRFLGLTNNPTGLLGTTDTNLAVFSVTNQTDTPIQDRSFYYIEASGWWHTYAPLGSAGGIAPHGCSIILTRIPTNIAPWRVIVPYSRGTARSRILDGIRDVLDRQLRHPSFDFERFGKGAPASDWVTQ